MIGVNSLVIVTNEASGLYGRLLRVVAVCKRKDMVGLDFGDTARGEYPTWFHLSEVRDADLEDYEDAQ